MGLDARFAQKLIEVVRVLEGLKIRVAVVSAYRTRKEQDRQYQRMRRGEIARAARPGRSCHEFGAAADLVLTPPRYDVLGRVVAVRGLSQPFPGDDPGHVEDTALCRELRGDVLPARPQLPSAGSRRGTLSDPPVTPPGPCGCP